MNPFESMITTFETDAANALGSVDSLIVQGLTSTDAAIANTLKNVDASIETAIKTALAPIALNVGPLAVGIGLFVLGSAMIVFSFGEDLTEAFVQSLEKGAVA